MLSFANSFPLLVASISASITKINFQTDSKITDLMRVFSALENNEKLVLCVLAIVHKPITIKEFERLVTLLDGADLLVEVPGMYFLTPERRERLLFKSLLRNKGKGFEVNRHICNSLVEEFHSLTSYSKHSRVKKLLFVLECAERVVPIVNPQHWRAKPSNSQRLVRDLYFTGQQQDISSLFNFDKNPQVIDLELNTPLVELCFLPFRLNKFLLMATQLQYQAFAALLLHCQMNGEPIDYPVLLLEQVCQQHTGTDAHTNNLRLLLAEHYLYQLRLQEFEGLQNSFDNSSYAKQLLGAFSFIRGENDDALLHFGEAIVAKNRISRRKNQYLGEVLGYFYKLALVASSANTNLSQEQGSIREAIGQIDYEQDDKKRDSEYYIVGRFMLAPLRALLYGDRYLCKEDFNSIDPARYYLSHELINLTHVAANAWCNVNGKTNSKTNTDFSALITNTSQAFKQRGYHLFAHLCDESSPSELVKLSRIYQAKEQWDIALDRLIALNPKQANEAEPEQVKRVNATRLVWDLDIGQGRSSSDVVFSLIAREQKLGKSGWSKGRQVSLKRLYEERERRKRTGTHDTESYLSASDKTIISAITRQQEYGYYGSINYELGGLDALKAAMGANNVYIDEDYSQAIEIETKDPSLLVNKQGDELCLSMADLSLDNLHDEQRNYSLTRLQAKSFQLVEFDEEHLKVAEIIGEGGLLIPVSAKQKALESIAAIAPLLNIQSDIEELDTGLETLDCDPRLFINIQPIKEGLVFTCLVMPFGEAGPAFKPGIGNTNLSTDLKVEKRSKRVATVRDLLNEESLLDILDEHCPAFLAMPANVLVVEDFEEALHVLEQLERAQRDKLFPLALRWPKGRKIQVSQTLKSEHFQLAINKKNEWFDLNGEVALDQVIPDSSQVVTFRKLLDLVKTTRGRFINLGNEQMLALSDELRNKLNLLGQVSDDGEFHPLASLQVEEATTGMRMKTIDAWDKQTLKMHEANDIQPELPSTLQAELRDYQVVGFDWASRLAHWGAGACLADDMGLGKTLQALALLLSRAADGPSLVIAPTSVCFNWQQEAVKFAPTLNIKIYADAVSREERDSLLADLSPFDCVVISYGLLQRESEKFSDIKWNTVIADEAQALKNPSAKRTKAACALRADFKMIMTGTPIENDLTELWSLFRFSNPGLLGNLKRFGQRFIAPIENAKEDKLAARQASMALKTLIQPFILRRMKNQVLTELPSRTEININIELEAEERAFYEALRLNAIDNISEASQYSKAGEQKIRMLAELVKLRQACCNPKLIMPESRIESGKLKALQKLLEELKKNKHKALIFSQFVGHLQLIKSHVESMGLSLQYLDGSTPQKERQQRVNAFQSGEGDVFLISLKAGGSGLNLTAADYVIHMDPWWNPAVEDQASDRAHRIGQTRPVTIYRLIAKATIEEKIVSLHQRKRDLADQLLAGNDVASKLSVEDMLNMLKQTF